MLRDLYEWKSVVDFGCGSGAWLAGAEAHGGEALYGFDGPWVDPTKLTSSNIVFTPMDFEKELPSLDKKVDLAISVEVAEHLYKDRIDAFFDAFCALSDVVVFSAAIPYQGGTHHVNEQPQSYWIEHFDRRGFDVFDIFRPHIWNDDEVRWWFRQNVFLFVRRGSDAIDRAKLTELESPLRDVVHPVNFVRKVRLNKERIKELEKEVASLERAVIAAAKQPGPAPSGKLTVGQQIDRVARGVKRRVKALRS